MRKLSRRRIAGAAATTVTACALFAVSALPASAMTVTFVRHGESQGNASGKIDTSVPGPHLTTPDDDPTGGLSGQEQSTIVGDKLYANGVAYDGIYVSNMIRTYETAQRFSDLTGMTRQQKDGFREIGAGIFEGQSERDGLGRLGYALAPLAWTLGARFVPIPGGENGNSFDARVDGALAEVEANGDQNPVVFSHGATIMFWTMMNVDNPDLLVLAQHPLGNTDVVVVEGSAEEGWTLKSWAGQDVGPANFPTKVFVNVRDLVVTPQTAGYNIEQAVKTGDISKIANAIRDGAVDVVTAPIKFGLDMAEDIGDEIGGLTQPASAKKVAPETKSTITTMGPQTVSDNAGADDQPATVEQPKVDSDTKVATIKRNGATDLTAGNKARPGVTRSLNRPGERVQEAVNNAHEQAASSVQKLGDAVKKLTGQDKKAKGAEKAEKDAA